MRIIEVQSSIFIYNKENDENISFFCSIIIRIKNLIKEYLYYILYNYKIVYIHTFLLNINFKKNQNLGSVI